MNIYSDPKTPTTHHPFAAGALLVLCFVWPSVGASDEASEHAVNVTGRYADEQFFAGSEVRVGSATTADLFLAGGEVMLDEVTADDVRAAGGAVRLERTTTRDLTAAGGRVEIGAAVGGDLVTAGGQVRLRREATVSGYAVVAGGDVELEGEIGGNLKVAGGRVRLDGAVGGDVAATAGQLVLGPRARIGGKLVYSGKGKTEIDAAAEVAGGVERRESAAGEISTWGVVGFVLLAWLVVVVGLMVLGIALQLMLPGVLDSGARTVKAHPWKSLGLGFALLVATPVAANLLAFTVIGIPLTLFAYAAYAVAVALALAAIAYWLGSPAARSAPASGFASTRPRRYFGTCLGLVILAVVAIVPLAGLLVLMLAVATGLGAVMIGSWARVRDGGGVAGQPAASS